MSDAQILLQALTLVMSTIQTCFLAYLAARFRTPWDMTMDVPKKHTTRPRPPKEPDNG